MKNFLAITLMAVMAAGCTGGDSEVAGSVRGVSSEAIRLGSHTDLSGQLAAWGVPTSNGMRQRFDEANEAGGVHGRRIELIVEDSQYQVPVAVKAVNKLIHVDEVFAIIGGMGTPHNNAVFDTLFEAGVPNLFPTTAAVSMYEPLHPLKFAYFVSYRDQARSGVKYFVDEFGVKTVCLQSLATDYGAEVKIGFEQAAEELGLDVRYTGQHKVSETDFVGTATSIKNAGCELLFMGPFIKDTILLYSAVRDAGWDGIVAGNMVPYLPEVAGAADGKMEGFYAVAPFYTPDFTSLEAGSWVADWHSRYVARNNSEPAAQSVIGYVIADVFIRALEAAGPEPTVENVLAALESISEYKDPFGGPTLSFSPTKHMGGDWLNLYQVKDGKWTTV